MNILEKSKLQQAIEWYKNKLSTSPVKKEKTRPLKFEYSFEDDSEYFCNLLIGKNIEVANQIVSRIDSRISIANQLGSLYAFEDYLGISIDEDTKRLREVLLSVEIVRSHAHQIFFETNKIYSETNSLNVYLDENKKLHQTVIRINQACNALIKKIGGRIYHPTTLVLGGFSNKSIIDENKKEFYDKLITEWKPIIDKSFELALLTQRFRLPNITADYEYLSLHKIDDYTILGQNVTKVKRKNSLVMYGAIARVNNNFKLITRDAFRFSKKINLKTPINNPFHQTYCLGIELIHFAQKTLDLLENKTVTIKEKQVVRTKNPELALSRVESCFGLIRHAYKIDEEKKIVQASIIIPQKILALNLKPTVEAVIKKERGEEGIKKAKFLLKSYYL